MNKQSILKKLSKLPWRKAFALFYILYTVAVPLAYVDDVVLADVGDTTLPVVSNPHMYVSYDGGVSYAERSYVRAGDFVRVEVDATDDVAVDNVEFRIRNDVAGGYITSLTHVDTPVSGDTYRFEFQIPVDGKYIDTHGLINEVQDGQVFWARAHDTSGNYTNANVTQNFSFDKTIPTVTTPVMQVSTDGGVTYTVKDVVKPGDLVRVETDATDSLSGVDYVEFRMQNSNTGEYVVAIFKPNTPQSGDTYRYDFTIPADGKYYNTHANMDTTTDIHTAWVRSYDVVGNYIHGKSMTFTFDNIVPSTEISDTSPGDNSLHNSAITISGTSIDPNIVDYTSLYYRTSDPVGSWTAITVLDNNSSAQPFNWTYDWTPSTEGVYDIKAAATDMAGNEEHSDYAYGIVYDTTAPDAPTIISPTNGEAFNTAPILNDWTDVTDDSGIAKYRIQYEYDDGHTFSGYPYRETTISQRNHTPAASEEGGVSFRVQAFDNAGNEGAWSEWTHYFYDLTPPSSDFTAPESNAYYNSDTLPIYIEGESIDDGSAVSFVEISVSPAGADTWSLLSTENNIALDNPYYWSYDWSPAAQGVYDLKVVATDIAGNIESTDYIYNLTLDKTKPTVSIITPTLDSYHNGDIDITGTVTDDLSGVRRVVFKLVNEDSGDICQINGRNWTRANYAAGVWDYSIPEGSCIDGYYKLIAVATDNSRNGKKVITHFYIDTTAPVLEFITPILDSYHNDDIDITGTVVDNLSGVKKVRVKLVNQETHTYCEVNGRKWNRATYDDSTDTWSYTVNKDSCVDGYYKVVARAYDNIGNSKKEITYIYIDTVSPVVEITAPLNDSLVNESLSIIGSVSDLNLSHYWFVVQDENGAIVAGPGVVYDAGPDVAIMFDWDTTIVDDGLYTIKLEARDLAGNKDSNSVQWVTVEVDNTPPDKPVWNTIYNRDTDEEIGCGGYTNTTNIQLDWDANTESDLVGYYFGTKNNDHHRFVTVDYYNGSMTPGNNPYYYTVIAIDEVGNESEISERCGLTLDQVNPTIDPVDVEDTYYEGDLFPEVNVTAHDDIKLAEMCFSIEGPDSLDYDLINFPEFLGEMCFTPEESVNNGWGAGTDTEFTWNLNVALEQQLEATAYFDTALLHEGEYIFRYQVTDMAGNVSDEVVTVVNLENIKPTLTFGSNQTIVEGSEAIFTGSFADPSYMDDYGPVLTNYGGLPADDSVWTAYIDYGDNSDELYKSFIKPGDIDYPNHTYTYNGEYTVTAVICESEYTSTDDKMEPTFTSISPMQVAPSLDHAFPWELGEGECDIKYATVTVTDLTPTVVITANPEGTVTTGTEVVMTANGSGGNTEYTYQWDGDCTGHESTSSVTPTVAGEYSCTVTLTDFDGDVTTDDYTFTANAPVVPVVATRQFVADDTDVTGDVAGVTDKEESEKEGDVLGESCNKVTLSGYVYVDENKDETRNEDEIALEGVVVILTDKDSKVVEEVTTDENGYWESSVCADKYTVSIDEETVDDKYDVKGVKTEVDLTDEDKSVDLDLAVVESKTLMDYWWILLIIIAIPSIYYVYSRFTKERA